MQNPNIKQKFYCFLQVFFLCFYRLTPGKASIYGGMFTFTAKPPELEMLVCVHFHSHHIHFFITPINPQLLVVTEKVPLQYKPSIIGSLERKSNITENVILNK